MFFHGLLCVGYLEDRRPTSNMDPNTVIGLLAEITLLWEPTLEAEALVAQIYLVFFIYFLVGIGI